MENKDKVQVTKEQEVAQAANDRAEKRDWNDSSYRSIDQKLAQLLELL